MKIKEVIKNLFSSRSSRSGSYSAALGVIVVAIALVAALLIGLLPDGVKQRDMSSDKIYSIGDTTAQVLGALTDDVKMTVTAAADTTDPRIKKLLSQYAEASPHVTVEYVDPVVTPSVLTNFGTSANTIVVQVGERTAAVPFSDIILYDESYYYYYGQYKETSFDGEGQLTAAIYNLTTDSAGTLVLSDGHGESGFSSVITDRLSKLGISTSSANLLTDGLPDDCDLFVINTPTSDLADDEKLLLEQFLADGGNLLVLGWTQSVSLPNFEALLADYGLTRVDGFMADFERYYQNNPLYLFPVLNSESELLTGLSSDATVLVINSLGYTITDPVRSTIGVESFLTTSENGYAITDDNQIQGEYVLGAVATEETGDADGSKLVLLACPTLIDDSILTSFPSLANADVFLKVVTWFLGDVEDLSIPAKSLEVTYNTPTGFAGYSALFIFIIPAALLGWGLVIWIRRRKA